MRAVSEMREQFMLTAERQKEVDEFLRTDETAKRFFLFFDSLRDRGVDAAQSARTSHLVMAGVSPFGNGGILGQS
jgi:hypothetical protein